MPSETSPAVAVATPVFNEQEVLPELVARLTAMMDGQPGYRW